MFRVLAQECEAFHGVPHIIGAIDEFNIPILALVCGGENYQCQNSFCSHLLQYIVDTKDVFWSYKFSWAGCMHDWTLFKVTKIRRRLH